MVVCRYYLQGNCHFGERCRFEHPRQQGFGKFQAQNSFGGGNNRFAPLSNAGGGDGSRPQGQQTIKDMSPQEIIDVISQEMKVWESSKMWPFSCFTYAKDGQCMTGFEDLSPEELRVEAYQMQKANNFQTYQAKVNQLINEYRMKRQALRAPQPDMKQKLMQEIQSHKAGSNKSNQSGMFGSSTSVFGKATAPQGLFGKGPAQPTPGLFSANTSGQNQFGQPQTGQNQFGQAQTGQNQFGQAQTSQSQFGQPQTGQSTFGAPSVFGGGQGNTSQGSVFGGSSQSRPSVFGTPAAAANQQTGSFAANTGTTPGLFGQTGQQQTGLFGKPAPQSAGTGVFGNAPAAPSQPAAQTTGTGLFGKGTPASIGTGATGLFGKPAAATGSVFGGNPGPGATTVQSSQQPGQTVQQDSIYTPLSQLTEEEKAQFNAPRFVLGKIPKRPPPRELI